MLLMCYCLLIILLFLLITFLLGLKGKKDVEQALQQARQQEEKAENDIRSSPGTFGHYVELGKALYKLNEMDEAEAAFKKGLELNDLSSSSKTGIAKVCLYVYI